MVEAYNHVKLHSIMHQKPVCAHVINLMDQCVRTTLQYAKIFNNNQQKGGKEEGGKKSSNQSKFQFKNGLLLTPMNIWCYNFI